MPCLLRLAYTKRLLLIWFNLPVLQIKITGIIHVHLEFFLYDLAHIFGFLFMWNSINRNNESNNLNIIRLVKDHLRKPNCGLRIFDLKGKHYQFNIQPKKETSFQDSSWKGNIIISRSDLKEKHFKFTFQPKRDTLSFQ